MAATNITQLQVKSLSAPIDWSFCTLSGFAELVLKIAELLYVDATNLAENLNSLIIVSESEPESADRGKIWINPSTPPEISIFTGGEWWTITFPEKDETPATGGKVQIGSAVAWPAGSPIPDGWQAVSGTQPSSLNAGWMWIQLTEND